MQARALTLAALFLTLPLAAQQIPSQIPDPANLMGERVSPPALADTLPINHGAPALEQLLRKLRTRASMMLIVAHPDDEDGGLLTLESRGMGARVAMLTLNRGEGGQNLMTGDFNEALGLIRTQELLAEDRYTGVDQFFGTEVDFGFSKTKEESFKMWTHDRVLYDAVRSVRLYRPLVLASVFIGGVTDGHGQHQVSGEINQEVFRAAADPKVFPEMGLPPWAPLRVYARVPFAPITDKGMFDYATGKYLPPHFHNYVTGANTTTPPQATVTIHEGDVPNIPSFEGKSYVQWARQGLALQKTQIGPNVRIPLAGRVDVGYTLYGSRTACTVTKSGAPCLDSETWASAKPPALPTQPQNPDDEDLFTGIDTSLPSISTLAPAAPPTLRTTLVAIDARIAEAQHLYNPDHLELTAPPLRDALRTLDTLITETESAKLPPDQKFNLLHELRVKRVQLNDATVLALQLTLTASLAQDVPTTAHSVTIQAKLGNAGSQPMAYTGVTYSATGTAHLPQQPASAEPSLSGGASRTESKEIALPPSEPETKPYFYKKSMEQPFYDVAVPSLRNAPATPAPFVVVAYAGGGDRLELAAIAANRSDRATPEQAAVVVPPISVAVSPSVGISTPVKPTQSLHATVSSSFQPAASGTVSASAIPSWKVEPASQGWTNSQPDDFLVSPKSHSPGSGTIDLSASYEDHAYTDGYRPVGYPGLTFTNYYIPATFKAVPVDVTTAPNLRIAYLPGTGDDVPQFLPSLGVKPTILNAKDLTLANLQHYDAILLGVRAYSAHPELQGIGSGPLNAYAQQGGIVILQYSSAGFDPASAPFPYTIPGDSAHNVVDEDQPVALLAPENPLLTWPNRITSADFNHWIEERGHGFASEWSPEYKPLLETHDPDQDPQEGGLLIAKVGKGAYIYCAFALYRQLPEGVPGAYRLLANLLSYAKNPSR